jgi:predicted amidohydrolase
VILTLHDNVVMPQATQTLEGARIIVLPEAALSGYIYRDLTNSGRCRPGLASSASSPRRDEAAGKGPAAVESENVQRW